MTLNFCFLEPVPSLVLGFCGLSLSNHMRTCTAVHSYNRSRVQKVTAMSKKMFFEEHDTIIVDLLGKSNGFVLIHFQKPKQIHYNRQFQRLYIV